MKTKENLRLYCGPAWPFEVPAGTPVALGPLNGIGEQTYIVPNPTAFGVSEHDAKYRYLYVPADAVEH